ncbi:chloride channel [Polychytrium aggregatum]|uniref:chloride channel n=1 Tax=Polychytrium aggregatum TaxID=110093 RepID=UPI0022FDF8D1|nr:chloride channel [Polychytrium aggregatum]KAI9206069.1 chloride channel [Polychytrium aggregatum]
MSTQRDGRSATEHPVLIRVDNPHDGSELPRQHSVRQTGSTHHRHLFANYDSIDFEEPDGRLLRQHYREQDQRKWSVFVQNIMSYLLALIISVIVALVFVLLAFATDKIGEWRIELFAKYFEESQLGAAIGVALATCIAFAVVPSLFILVFTPDAIGSGMTQVIAFLNGAAVLSGVTWQTVIGKCIGVVGLVSSGLYSGIDGPMAKIGSSIAILGTEAIHNISFVRRLFYGEGPTLAKMDTDDTSESIGATSLFNVLEHKNLRLFATLGAAASIAAIFRAPVGGAVFALEEATSFWDPNLMTRTIFSTTIAYIVVCVANRFTGVDGTLLDRIFTGAATLFPTNISCFQHFSAYHVASFIVIAIFAALVGQLHNMALSAAQRTRKRLLIDRDSKGAIWPKVWRILEVIVICIITTAVTLMPMAENSVDVCSPLYNTVKHALQAAPDCAQFASGSDLCAGTTFNQCYQELDYVCLPYTLSNAFTENVLLSYQRLKDASCPSSLQTFVLAASNSSTVNGTTPAPMGPDNSTYLGGQQYLTTAIAGPYLSVFTSLGLKFNQNEGGHGDSTHGALVARSESSQPSTNAAQSSDLCYWELRSLLWSTPEKQLKLLLLRGLNGVWQIKTLIIFAVIYWILSTLTYYIALPTDVVVPNLIIGAAFGRIVGVLIDIIGSKIGLYVQDPGYYALVAMASFWASTSRLVLTVTVVAFELTGDYTALPVLIIVTFIGAWVSSAMSPESIYHKEMENNEVPYLSHEPYSELKYVVTSQIMNRNVTCIEANMKLSSLEKYANQNHHSGFPVVEYYNIDHDGDGKVDDHFKPKPIGYVRRDRLQAAVEGYNDEDSDPDRIVSIVDIMNSSPFIVRDNSTASKVFSIFRQMGLRQMLVVDRDGFMVGMISRTDLLKPKIEKEEREEREEREKREKREDERTATPPAVEADVTKH